MKTGRIGKPQPRQGAVLFRQIPLKDWQWIRNNKGLGLNRLRNQLGRPFQKTQVSFTGPQKRSAQERGAPKEQAGNTEEHDGRGCGEKHKEESRDWQKSKNTNKGRRGENALVILQPELSKTLPGLAEKEDEPITCLRLKARWQR